MANTSAIKRGWHWDEAGSKLSVYVDGTEASYFATTGVGIGDSTTLLPLVAATYPLAVYSDIQTSAAEGNFISQYFETDISSGVDLSGTAQILGTYHFLNIEGADTGVTTWSSTGGCFPLTSYYYTNSEDIDITNGVHGCLMLAPYYGADYTVTSATADFVGLYIFNCGNASATIGDHDLSAIAISSNSGCDTWGSAIKFPAANKCANLFNFSGDDNAGGMQDKDGNSATTGNPDGYIKFISGGTTMYIWTYTKIAG